MLDGQFEKLFMNMTDAEHKAVQAYETGLVELIHKKLNAVLVILDLILILEVVRVILQLVFR